MSTYLHNTHSHTRWLFFFVLSKHRKFFSKYMNVQFSVQPNCVYGNSTWLLSFHMKSWTVRIIRYWTTELFIFAVLNSFDRTVNTAPKSMHFFRASSDTRSIKYNIKIYCRLLSVQYLTSTKCVTKENKNWRPTINLYPLLLIWCVFQRSSYYKLERMNHFSCTQALSIWRLLWLDIWKKKIPVAGTIYTISQSDSNCES